MTTLEASLKLRDQFTATLNKVDNALNQTAQTMGEFERTVAGPAQALNNLANLAAIAVSNLNSALKVGFDAAFKVVKSSTESILMLFANFGNGISNKLNLGAVSDMFGSFFNGLQTKASATFSGIGKMFNDLTGGTKKIQALEDIDRQITQLTNKEAKIQINIDQAAQVKSEIDAVDKRLDRLSSAKAKIQTDITNVTIAKDRIAKLDTHMDKLNNKKTILQVEADKIVRAQSHLADVQAEIDKLNSKKIDINTSSLSTTLSKITSGFSSIASASASAAKQIGSNFGDAFNGAKNSFSQFNQDMKNGFTGISKSSDQATSSVKDFVAALGLLKVAGAALGAIKSSIDGAVDRFDTLNQFPKMMHAVGFSMDEVDVSRKRLVDGIDGLPTALNEVVPTTQRIATMTGDLDNATRTTISLNNAFLASGADSARAAQGLEQYVQMLGRGEVNLTSWRSLMDTMPVALNDVAKAFGYTGKSAQYDLYDALNDGHVTFDEFNAKMIEMFDTGTEGAERALIGSEGIKTSFKNIRTAITNGVEGSIRKLDELSEAFTGKNIAQHLDGMKDNVRGFFKSINGYVDESGEYIEGFLDKLPNMVGKIKPYLDVLSNAFEDIKAPIGSAISAIGDSLSELMGTFDKDASVSGFERFVGVITSGIETLAGFIERHSDTIAKFITMLPKMAAAFIGFKIGKGVLIPLLGLGKGIATVLGATGKLAGGLGGSFLKIFGLGKNKKGSPLGDNPLGDPNAMSNAIKPMDSFLNTLNGFAKGAANLALVFGVIKLIEQAAKALKTVSESVPDDFKDLALKLGMMGAALTSMGAFIVVAGKLAEKNLDTAIAGLLMVAGLSASLMLAAEALKQVDEKVPDSIGNMLSKMTSMGIAIGAIGGLVAVVGLFASKNPLSAIAGLAVVALLSLELMLAAEAMKQVDDKVPDNIGEFASKIANMSVAIGAFAGLATVVGLVMMTGIGAAAVLIGLATIALVALELMLVAEAIQQVDQKVPDDFDGVKGKVDTMVDVIQYFAQANLGTIGDVFGNLTGLINAAIVADVVDQLIYVAENLSRLEGIEVPGAVDETIQELLNVVDMVNGEGGFWESVKNSFKSGFETSTLTNVAESVDSMFKIANDLESIGKIDLNFESISEKVGDITEICDLIVGDTGFWKSLGEKFSSGFDTSTYSNVLESLEYINQIADDLMTLSGINFDRASITDILNDVLAVIEFIGNNDKEGFWKKLSKSFGSKFDASALNNVSTSVEHLIQIANDLEALGSVELNVESVIEKIRNIEDVISRLNGFPELVGLDGIETMVRTFNDLANELQGFMSMAEVSITQLESVSTSFETAMTAMQTSTKTAMTGIVELATTAMNSFNTTIETGMATATTTAQTGSIQIVNAFSGLRGELYAVGQYAMAGLATGIQAGTGAAIAAASAAANSVAIASRSTLDVRSPSRVMMAIGKFASEGLANGITAGQNLVQKASDALALATIPNLSTYPDLSMIPDQLATVTANGVVTNSVHVDDQDIAKLRASASQTVIVQHKQVVPQVTVNVENNGTDSVDVKEIAEIVSGEIMDLIDSDLS